jgi:hypothetical protein
MRVGGQTWARLFSSRGGVGGGLDGLEYGGAFNEIAAFEAVPARASATRWGALTAAPASPGSVDQRDCLGGPGGPGPVPWWPWPGA